MCPHYIPASPHNHISITFFWTAPIFTDSTTTDCILTLILISPVSGNSSAQCIVEGFHQVPVLSPRDPNIHPSKSQSYRVVLDQTETSVFAASLFNNPVSFLLVSPANDLPLESNPPLRPWALCRLGAPDQHHFVYKWFSSHPFIQYVACRSLKGNIFPLFTLPKPILILSNHDIVPLNLLCSQENCPPV